MDWIYLSPHLDDAVFSCGGLLASQRAASDQVTILTLCAGDPPDGPLSSFAEMLHVQWALGRDAAARRREEDRRACKILGVEAIYLPVPDCIYRRSPRDGRALYDSEGEIFGFPDPEDTPLIQELAQKIFYAALTGAQVVCPLAIGGHVDHRLTRAAAESLGIPLWYYPDYPYVALHPRWLSGKPGEGEAGGWTSQVFPISDDELSRWQQAVGAYRSQLPVFWPDENSMAEALAVYHRRFGGILLWQNAALPGSHTGLRDRIPSLD
jgi:LmbE family N-acetylglucosaminyl deacetylase